MGTIIINSAVVSIVERFRGSRNYLEKVSFVERSIVSISEGPLSEVLLLHTFIEPVHDYIPGWVG